MKQFVRVMKALSDPNRLKIMKMLEIKALCVCEITSLLGLAQSTVSKHLKILEDAGLVDSWRQEGWVNYCLPEEYENKYAEELEQLLVDWLAENPEIKKILAQVYSVDRLRLNAA